jgi:hypothetical protein
MSTPDDLPADDASPYTVAEFCHRNRISLTSYYELRSRGQGPREMRVLSKVLISPAAEADWRHARETPDAEIVERLRQRGLKAGAGSAAAKAGRSGR